LPNPDRLLKPGLLMQVDLLNNPRNTLAVPEEALIPSGRENFVLVVDRSAAPAVAERRKITIGARRPGVVETLAGLKAGEWVVVHGAMKVRPGQPVTVTAEQTGDETLAQLLNRQAGGPTP
jgi:membrane fusion protein (multidrug efflux system)